MYLNELSLLDYTFFGATLILSTLIGIYHGCFGNKQKTLSTYLWSNKKMKIIPIAISLAVSHFSGITLLIVPAETYRYGSMIWWNACAYIFMALAAIYIYLPVFYNLELTSVYEYLEMRFNRKIRILALVFYILSEILVLTFYAYSQALTFSTASSLNLFVATLILTAICIFYTTLGGLRTVIWTDVLQFFIIIISLLIIFSVGFDPLKSFSEMFKIGIEGKRLEVFNFGFDLTQRDNFWASVIGSGCGAIAVVVVHQTGVQKFLALPNYKDCIPTLLYNFISILVVYTFCVLIGLKMYFNYKDCDPLLSKKIQKHDQIVPFFITETASKLPGISGLFLAAICSASLSSMSSSLNSLSGVAYKDILCLLLKKTPSDRAASIILKTIVVVIGLLIPFLVLATTQLDEIYSSIPMITGSFHAPLLGVFTLGMLFPQANSKGAFCGVFFGFLSVLAISVPAKLYQRKGLIKYPTKPLSVSGCNITNFTQIVDHNFEKFEVPVIFRVSFYYYLIMGTMATILFGLFISYLTGKTLETDNKLLSPFTQFLLKKKRQHTYYVELPQPLVGV